MIFDSVASHQWFLIIWAVALVVGICSYLVIANNRGKAIYTKCRLVLGEPEVFDKRSGVWIDFRNSGLSLAKLGKLPMVPYVSPSHNCRADVVSSGFGGAHRPDMPKAPGVITNGQRPSPPAPPPKVIVGGRS